MFGYVLTSTEALPEPRQQRFRAFYCGLCRNLRMRYGLSGTLALSFDMTFLALLLNALYEPGERCGEERCVTRPVKPHQYIETKAMDYAADMNVALAYHKCMDNWRDDRSLISAAEARLLKTAYSKVIRAYPEQCKSVLDWLEEIDRIEREDTGEIDPPVNATGRMLGELFVYRRDDVWSDALRSIGDGLGRFIYFMDAYDDLPEDMRRNRFNPLKGLSHTEDFERICRSALMMMIADAAEAFERLPIVQDADILRNVLYSGIWSKYAVLQRKRNARGGTQSNAGSL